MEVKSAMYLMYKAAQTPRAAEAWKNGACRRRLEIESDRVPDAIIEIRIPKEGPIGYPHAQVTLFLGYLTTIKGSSPRAPDVRRVSRESRRTMGKFDRTAPRTRPSATPPDLAVQVIVAAQRPRNPGDQSHACITDHRPPGITHRRHSHPDHPAAPQLHRRDLSDRHGLAWASRGQWQPSLVSAIGARTHSAFSV